MFAFGSGKEPDRRDDQKSMKEVLYINDVASKKIKLIGKPKTLRTFSNFLSNDSELMQESATQIILIMPKDVFDSNEELKAFFEEDTSEVINILQKQAAALKIIGQIGGIVKEECSGKIINNFNKKP